MEKTKNNLQLSSTTKKIGSSSQEVQDRLLAQLNEPFQIRDRTRIPLSKFTITCHSHSSSSQNHIPAYRTVAQENLPTISPKEKQQMNILPFTGMPYYSPPRPDQATLSSRTGSSKTRRCLLQKRTIHRSLEDLRSTSTKSNEIFPSSRKSTYFSLSSPSRQDLIVDHKEHRNWNKQLSQASPESLVYPPTEMKSNLHLRPLQIGSNANKLGESGASYPRHACGPGGDFVGNVNVLPETEDEVKTERDLQNLAMENELLKRRIKEGQRKCTFYRIVNAFAFEALKRRSERLLNVEQSLTCRKEECAARVILHHLLLNSWRITKGQVTAIRMENTQMHKTIDNQSLQLNVIRKMQSMEKDKTSSVLQDYNQVKINYCRMMQENESIKKEYSKVLEEKRSLETHLRSLSAENSRLNTDVQLRLDKKEMQLKCMELDRFRAEKFSKENEQLVKETALARKQIKELTEQQTHWQEKAMSYESKCYELKQEVESKERAYERVLYEKRDISKENEILSLSRTKLEKTVEEAQGKLIESTTQRKQLEKSYHECKEELEDLEDQVEYLQSTLRQYKKENVEIRQKLYDCTLKNVKRRRVWGAALYFLVSPIEAFKRLYFGPPAEMQPSRVATLPAPDKNWDASSNKLDTK